MRLTISEAAAHCGYKSRTVIYRLHQSGLLRDYEAGKDGRSQLLESHPPGRCSLREHIAACVQLRHDSPLGQSLPPNAALSDDAALDAAMAEIDAGLDAAGWAEPSPDWERIAATLNAYLGDSWPAPPWSSEQAATVAMALSLAQEAAVDA